MSNRVSRYIYLSQVNRGIIAVGGKQMKNFDDRIWERYQESRKRLDWLERRYIGMSLIILLQVLFYVYFYFKYFK